MAVHLGCDPTAATMLRPLSLAAAALLLSGAAAAQTCSGVLRLSFVDPASADTARPPVNLRSVGVRATFLSGSLPDGAFPTAAAALAAGHVTADATVHLPAYARAYVPGSVLALSPECGTELLSLVLTYHGQTMTLDVYHVPNHVGVELDGDVPFRPGRFVLDLARRNRLPGSGSPFVYSAAAVRAAG